MNIFQKLQQARVLLASQDLKKTGHNTYAQYTYFELGDFLPQIQSVFLELGLSGVVTTTRDEGVLRIYNTADLNEMVEFTIPMGTATLKGCHDIQNVGASITYMRRYLYAMALELVESDTLDRTSGYDGPVPSPKGGSNYTQQRNRREKVKNSSVPDPELPPIAGQDQGVAGGRPERESTRTSVEEPIDESKKKIKGAKTLAELAEVWSALTPKAKKLLADYKDDRKGEIIDAERLRAQLQNNSQLQGEPQ